MGLDIAFLIRNTLLIAIGQRDRDSKRRSLVLFTLYGNRSVLSSMRFLVMAMPSPVLPNRLVLDESS